MEEINILKDLLQNVAFPILACGCMFLLYVKQSKEHLEQITKQSESHKEEVKHMTDALNNNTIVLNRILERLGGGEDV